MEVMWSPWRSKYIGTFKDEEVKQNEECFFCYAIENKTDDEGLLVVWRGENSIILLNKYPYNNGHLLIAPLRHIGDIAELADKELIEIQLNVRDSVAILNDLYKPHGFNIGVNIGRSAGAGIPGHIHWHVIPRWNGDTSFMSTVADTKIISADLDESWQSLKGLFLTLNNQKQAKT